MRCNDNWHSNGFGRGVNLVWRQTRWAEGEDNRNCTKYGITEATCPTLPHLFFVNGGCYRKEIGARCKEMDKRDGNEAVLGGGGNGTTGFDDDEDCPLRM